MIIGRLTGEVAAIGSDHLLIDVRGVGYVALAGGRLLARLRAGDPVSVHVETRITENSITLFAFSTDEERAWFVRLQDVPGVAGKSALAILDALSPAEILDAVTFANAAAFTSAKGIGRKLAERITAELAGKPPPATRFGRLETGMGGGTVAAERPAGVGTSRAEAVSALVNLGYGQAEAARAVAAAGDGSADVSTLVRAALKEMMR